MDPLLLGEHQELPHTDRRQPELRCRIFQAMGEPGTEPFRIRRYLAQRLRRRYAHQLGLSHVSPHSVRRFVGTELAKRDIRQAQKALGHARIETTARHYVLDELAGGLTDGLF